MLHKGTLFLVPNLISDESGLNVLTRQSGEVLPSIRHFLVEDLRNARRFLSRLKIFETVEQLNFSVLDKDTKEAELQELCRPLLEGYNVGIISESGCPGIADPGSAAVRFAHQHHVRVVPLTGPSSVLLALMASGLNGQRFAFHGYLPISSRDASRVIKAMEKESRATSQTQIFIETPYRNKALFNHLVSNLNGETHLCIAVDLTGSEENIAMKRISEWRSQAIELPRKPAIFLFLA